MCIPHNHRQQEIALEPKKAMYNLGESSRPWQSKLMEGSKKLGFMSATYKWCCLPYLEWTFNPTFRCLLDERIKG